MKYKDIVRLLKDHGFLFVREGGNHEIWTNREINVAIPRHKEIPEGTIRAILKQSKIKMKK